MGWPEDWTCLNPVSRVKYTIWLMESGDEQKARAKEALSMLQQGNDEEAVWEKVGGLFGFSSPQVLLFELRQYENGLDEARVQLEGEEAPRGGVRGVPSSPQTASTSHRSKHQEQQPREHTDLVQALSRLLAYACETTWEEGRWEDGIPRVAKNVASRVDRLKAIGNGQVPACVKLAWETLSRCVPRLA